ncbi:hypothetical protein B0T24DRAFT_577945 [Lasiosphaeria ovina]|uniref:Uncharacterized protein n=1 Tax=Lasiosphaeria ovina TaxID=92902 RepID=A0AAE0K7T4_9PEZI|nr:hypothetical protein B0T24DRAFT_577945 [Lasiosphaeria ovina]
MEGVERTLPAVEGGFGLLANLDDRSPQTTRGESKATAQDAVACFICSALFPTSQELRSHVWFYQDEIAKLTAKIHELLAHRGQHLNVSHQTSGGHDDTERGYKVIGGGHSASRDSGSPARGGARDKVPTAPRWITMRGLSRSRRFECPHRDCEGLQRIFTRQQDLVRHFTTHFRCNEFCQYCSTLFTQASKYMSHKCTEEGGKNRSRYFKMRIEALRRGAKKELRRSRANLTTIAEHNCLWKHICVEPGRQDT